jgi:hypothetical protein
VHVQDEAQSIGLCILCLGAYEAGACVEGRAGTPEKPILLVWYQVDSPEPGALNPKPQSIDHISHKT